MPKVRSKIANVFSLLKQMIDENPEYKKEIYNQETNFVFNARLLFTAEEDENQSVSIIFNNGNIEIIEETIKNPTLTLKYKKVKDLGKLPRSKPEEIVNMLLKNKIHTIGNMSHMTKFFFLMTYVLLKHKDAYDERIQNIKKEEIIPFEQFEDFSSGTEHMKNTILNYKTDNVKYLNDLYLGKYKLKDFERLNYLKYVRSVSKLEVCPERSKLITEICKREGYTPEDGNTDHPGLKMGKIVNYILSHKKPLIQDWDYLPGTSTTKRLGTMIYPEFGAMFFWPELYSIDNRELNPHLIDQEAIDILDNDVFPFWMDRNIREYVRTKSGNPLSQQMDEHFVFYFMWKTQAISHTIPGFPNFLKTGINELLNEAASKEKETTDSKKEDFYKGIQLALTGVLNYTKNLSNEAVHKADTIEDENASEMLKMRKKELLHLGQLLLKVPAEAPKTLEEAIISIWIMWIALTQENAHMGLSLGRLDHWLQPYFESDMEKITSDK
ncbi:MAG: pyruvate formate lyase family protein, partial [Promethearchaeota archaeon]